MKKMFEMYLILNKLKLIIINKMKYSFAVLAIVANVSAIQLHMDLEKMTEESDNVLMQFK
jgi:hypothetical protein